MTGSAASRVASACRNLSSACPHLFIRGFANVQHRPGDEIWVRSELFNCLLSPPASLGFENQSSRVESPLTTASAFNSHQPLPQHGPFAPTHPPPSTKKSTLKPNRDPTWIKTQQFLRQMKAALPQRCPFSQGQGSSGRAPRVRPGEVPSPGGFCHGVTSKTSPKAAQVFHCD